eukprot:SAG31_NODE_691_length_12779_cov_19.035095_13_plen_191_part_00
MKKLDHPNVCKLHEVIQDEKNTHVYIVSEFCACGTLEKYRATFAKGRVPLVQLRPILGQLCTGLAYLHDGLGMAHCDLKPDNFMLSTVPSNRDGVCVMAPGAVKLVDFGTAQLVTRNADGTPDDSTEIKHKGTTAFYAPEMCTEVSTEKIHWFPVDVRIQIPFHKWLFLSLETACICWCRYGRSGLQHSS